MKARPVALNLTMSWRRMAPRLATALLLSASIMLLVLNKADPVMVRQAQTAVGAAITPALSFLGQPLISLRKAGRAIAGYSSALSDNRTLGEDNRRLIAWRDTALRLAAENDTLRAQLRVAPDPERQQVTARVVSDASGDFVNSLLLAAGSANGLEEGQPAVTAAGDPQSPNLGALVGRIVQTGEHSSRLLLITDVNSRIPVILEHSQIHAILAGDNADRPQLLFLPPGSSVAVGERIVTSGSDRRLPAGVAVGAIASNDQMGIRVEPLADLGRLDFVSVLKYDEVQPLPSNEPASDAAGHGSSKPRRH